MIARLTILTTTAAYVRHDMAKLRSLVEDPTERRAS